MRLIDFYLACEKYEIKRFDVEPEYGKVIPDAYAEIGIGKDTYLFFVEVHMAYGYQKFDQQKYEDLYHTWTGKYFPRVVIVSDRAVTLAPSQIKYIVLRDGYKISEIFR